MALRVALFGGAFNPVHLGHVFCACWAVSVGQVDEVWLLPSARHPYGKPLLDWELRWQLCQAAFAPYPFVQLRDDEQRNPSGHTWELFEQLRTAHPQHLFVLLGGSDTAADVPNWQRGAELAQMLPILVVPRSRHDNCHPAALPAISSTLVRTRLAQGQPIDDLVPASVGALLAGRQPVKLP